MRLLHRASVVLHVVDDFTGEIPPRAAAYCPTLDRRGLRNPSGYHLFSDLPPGRYDFRVSCPGYLDQETQVLLPDENGHRICTVRLFYSRANPTLPRRQHLLFLLSDGARGDEPLAERPVELTLAPGSSPLRAAADAAAGDGLLTLNAGLQARLLRRELLDEEGTSHWLMGVEPERWAYRLDRPLEAPLAGGSRLTPVWRCRTDREGGVVLPVSSLLLPEGERTFVLRWGERERTAVAAPFSQNRRVVPVRF